MTGQEIAETFNNQEVLQMEARLKDIETRLQETHDRLAATDDWDELEELRETSATLHEESRRLLADIRKAKEKFSDSIHFGKTN